MRNLLILTLVTGLALSQGWDGCKKGCAYCHNDKCFQCFELFLEAYQCTTSIPVTDKNCYLFDGNNQCRWCKEGYALRVNEEQNLEQGFKQCYEHKVDKCVLAVFEHDSFDDTYCSVCENGYPTQDFSKCGGWNNGFLQQGVSTNCLWGMRDERGTTCMKCDKGYMVAGGTCIKTSMEGCMLSDVFGQSCDFCDVWNGYYMNHSNTCSKNPSSIYNSIPTEKILFNLIETIRKRNH